MGQARARRRSSREWRSADERRRKATLAFGAAQVTLRPFVAAELAILDELGAAPFDVHSHTGADVDGTVRTCEEHVEALAAFGGRSVIFPLCVTGGYEAENRRVVEESERHAGTLVPFARLDPRVDDRAAAVAALANGAMGLKLHPRAEDFRLDHPNVDAIAAVAADARAPVLIHAGAGVGSLGAPIVELAERHRSCPIVLAHAAVSDLVWLGPVAGEHPNLFFDTSWWNPSDLLALFAQVPPGQILFGSDEPYMDLGLVLATTLRCARFAGLSDDAIALVCGRRLERLLAGETVLDAGPAPGPVESRPSLAESRLATLVAAAGGCMLSGGNPAQILELAALAVEDRDRHGSDGDDASRAIPGLIAEATSCSDDAPWALAMALTLLLTPGVEAPVATA
jgi:predicted TIM-barrel fold metal-dependent hydrolase